MSNVIHIPIEEYPNRYTEDFRRWFEDAFTRKGVPFHTVLGERMSEEIRSGSVLDAVGTNYYKATQLQKIMELFNSGRIHNGDKFFFADAWFPGMEMIPYTAKLMGLDVKVYGILHAGTYDRADFTYKAGMEYFGQYAELSWMSIMSKVFVGSDYHAQILGMHRGLHNSGIEVTGLPLVVGEIQKRAGYIDNHSKENIVVFNHRPDREKRPDLFYQFAEKLHTLSPDTWFLMLSPRGLTDDEVDILQTAQSACGGRIEFKTGMTRTEYYQQLARCKVVFSSAEQETFGYSVAEACALGAIPVVPDKLSYATMYPENLRYSTLDEAVERAKKHLVWYCSGAELLVEHYEQSADRMIDSMFQE